jgi:hypothetical protein
MGNIPLSMKINFRIAIPKAFDSESRVWVYQNNRIFTKVETLQVNRHLKSRMILWKDQNPQLKTYARLFFKQFIIFMFDHTSSEINDFNTENLIGLIKNIEKDFQVVLSDRQMLAFIIANRIQLLPLKILNDVIDKDLITKETLYFNNTILTKKELLTNWIIPVKESWLGVRVA